MFTLSIFTEVARRRVEFWRPLGFISPVETHRTSAEKATGLKGQSCLNFHLQLRLILDGLIQNQRGNDTVLNNTTVTLAGRRQVCRRIHTPMLFVIADGEAADMLVGRYGNHNLNVQRICRRCNVESKHLSNPNAKFNLFKQKYVYRCVARDDIHELKAISQYAVFNAFFDIWFGVKGVGILDSIPSDLMHVLKQGLINYSLKIFFRLIPNSMKRNLDQMLSLIHI